MAIAAENPTDRVEQLIRLTERLTDLVASSAQAFEGRRPQDALVNLAETGQLANLYRHESARVRANPALVAAAPATARARLVRATEAFDAVLARQSRAVEAARFVTEGLVRAIAEEIAGQRQQSASYGAGGRTTQIGAATAITLNQRA